MLIENYCSKGGRALPVQSGNLAHRAEVRADTYAELRAVSGADILAEKMAPMQKSLQEMSDKLQFVADSSTRQTEVYRTALHP